MSTEVDGSGSQGLFIHLDKKGHSRLCGFLLKQDFGIKDAWVTPFITPSEVKRYYHDAFDDTVMLRLIDESYLSRIISHFLAVSVERGEVPGLHFLEIQEAAGLQFLPERLDVEESIQQLAVQIHPFTPERYRLSLERSKTWTKNKQFTESWYIENTSIDKIVNRSSSFLHGVKVCRFEEAMASVFEHELEPNRDRWLFHFLWVALWLKAKARKNEQTWQDSFFLAYAIQSGIPLHNIPIMQEICHQIVINSVETMQARRTYLHHET